MEKDNTLELLLGMDVQAPREENVKIKRLSEICGKDVVFRVRQISYNRLHEIVEQHRMNGDISVFTVLAGVVSPNLKSKDLMQKYGAVTPADMLEKLLLPGEIEDLDREIERLCGYRYDTLEEVQDVKKK